MAWTQKATRRQNHFTCEQPVGWRKYFKADPRTLQSRAGALDVRAYDLHFSATLALRLKQPGVSLHLKKHADATQSVSVRRPSFLASCLRPPIFGKAETLSVSACGTEEEATRF